MKPFSVIFFYLFLIFLVNISSFPQSADYNRVFDQISKMKIDESKVADVSTLTISRDACIISFIKGKMFAATPVGDFVRALVFIGDCNIKYKPGNEIEENQLNRFYKVKSLNESPGYFVLLFADSTYDEINRQVNFVPGQVPEDANKYLRRCLSYFVETDSKYVSGSFLRSYLENVKNDLFAGFFKSSFDDEMVFLINPFADEEVQLRRENENVGIVHGTSMDVVKGKKIDYTSSEIINSFRKENEEPSNYKKYKEKRDLITVSSYKIDSYIEDNGYFKANSEIKLSSTANKFHWFTLSLYYDLTVDSIYWGDGTKAEFSRGEENPDIWIKFPENFEANKNLTLNISYQGDLLSKIEDYTWFVIKAPDSWYPRYGYRERLNYELTFHYPEKYILASVGNNISTTVSDGILTSKWVSDLPIRNASFNMGLFNKLDLKTDDNKNVEILVGKSGHGTDSEKDAKRVGEDMIASLKFYSTLFGSIPYRNLYVSEIPQSHGEAFPGLLHLAWSTFNYTSTYGSDEQFRAHEVAHQWWGIGVDFVSYHDQWLSEGLSDYSGLMYTQAILKDNNKFFDLLDNMKDALINARTTFFSKGIEPGPIYLGYRNSTSETEGDYSRVVYYKGAWVMHMLRSMMIDLKTMNEDVFNNMMKDFYETYKGKKASTTHFQKIVEKHVNTNMDWFFNQWIYSGKIPHYIFAYKVEQTPDGKYSLKCRVRSENVSEDFKSIAILKIIFSGDRLARVKVPVTGNNYQFAIPLGIEPEDVVFNDLHSILCELDTEDWD